MKNIYLIRHAKSDWSKAGQPDIDRPLNQRGYNDAHLIGAHLKGVLKGNILIISSPAIRAISTALIIAREIDYSPGKILIDKNIYDAAEEVYFDLLPTIENSFDTVLIFGHNPTISYVFSKLTKTVYNDLPTCSVSALKVETSLWSGVLEGKNEILLQLIPAHLKEN